MMTKNRNRGFATAHAATMVFQHYGLAKTQSQSRDSKAMYNGASVVGGKNIGCKEPFFHPVAKVKHKDAHLHNMSIGGHGPMVDAAKSRRDFRISAAPNRAWVMIGSVGPE
jgi:hypothetical protein